MARALTAQEKLRYPWASRITDYVPVGRWRRIAFKTAWGGLALYIGGTLAIFVFSSYLRMVNGLPDGVAEFLVTVPAFLAMAVGFFIGLVTAVQAARQEARPALAYSVAAMLPGILTGILLLVLN
jgi:hypothetical protein